MIVNPAPVLKSSSSVPLGRTSTLRSNKESIVTFVAAGAHFEALLFSSEIREAGGTN